MHALPDRLSPDPACSSACALVATAVTSGVVPGAAIAVAPVPVVGFRVGRIVSWTWGVMRRPAPWLVLGCLAGVVLLERWARTLGGPEALLERFGAGAPVAMVGIQAALATAPVPSELFALVSAAAYGWPIGALMTWAGWTLGAMIQYGVARQSTRGTRSPTPPGETRPNGVTLPGKLRLPRFLARLPLDHPVLLVCVRWLPMGYHFANITAGARRVPVWRQLWTAALGAIPGAIVWAGVGAGVSLGA